MTQVRPNDALQHRSRQERQRLQQRADTVSILLTAALVIGLHAAWFGWQTQGTPASAVVATAMAARHHVVAGIASF